MKKEITDLADTSRGIRYTIVVILIILLGGLIGGSKVFGQEKVSLNVSVDGRLTLLGDENNSPLTANTLVKIEMQGNQQTWGFMHIAPEYEYADLSSGNYHRYSANVGYTFNKFAIERLEVGGAMGFGFIIHKSHGTFFSLGAQVDFGYRVTDRLRFVTTMQLVDRTEKRRLVSSIFGGVKYYLN
tara:strand:+ start:191 stop:745 length:555 start_codon:yes stop_codon:yes gene_type:complete